MMIMRVKSKAVYPSAAGVVITVAAAFAAMTAVIFIISDNPAEVLYYFFTGPFQNKYYLGNMLNSSIPLILTGLGVAFAFRASMFNLGGEGQVYSGGLAATAVCLIIPSAPGPAGILLAVTAAVLTGAVIAGASGFFRYKWGTDELITSFLISGAMIYVVDHLITTVFNDPQSNLLTTGKVAEQFFLFKIFPPSSLDVSIIAAVILAAAGWYFMFRTRYGYELRICGLNPEFAGCGGINTGRQMIFSMCLSGGLHGLAGAVSILGTHHMCLKGFSNGIGWNGIAVALIAGNNPVAVIPAALFFAYIESGASSAMINSDVTIEIAMIVKSVVFFLITSKVIYNFFTYSRRAGN